ncbi:MAG: RNA-binding protein [Candidatus Omnitrophica bacterium]|nr:RNA-binding protein [Candidatus Omnitrophota bacterium]
MQNKLYVGNLSYDTTDDNLKELFGQHGTVQSATVIKDNYTGRSKGFGFVEMASQAEAEGALSKDGSDFMGRNIKVSIARPQERSDRGSRGGGGGRKFGGGGGGFSKRRSY